MHSPKWIYNRPAISGVLSSRKERATINIANSLQKTDPEHQSALDLEMGHQPNCIPLADDMANPYDYEDFPKASQPSATFAVGTTHHASTQHITNSHTVVLKSLTGASTPFRSLPSGTTNTNVMSHYPACAISSVQHTSPKTFQLHKEGDTFTPQSSPPTVYHDIRPSPYTQRLNHLGNQARSSSNNVSQITEALAKVI